MFLRDAPGSTLATVREALDDRTQTTQTVTTEVKVDLVEDNTISIGNVTVPASGEGITAIGNWLEVPSKFLQRLDADLQQHLLTSLLERTPATANFVYNDEGVKQVRDPNAKFIDPRRLVDSAINVIDPTAPVIDHWRNTDEFRLDVIAPEGFDRGIGGDPQVGDLTRGGIRIGVDLKHNLAPWVQPYMYRLICTNGMETTDEGLKVDARGSSVDEVLREFEAQADRAFRRVEAEIAAFYDLRTQQVDNPERTLIRMAEERGLPARTVLTLAERVPAYTDENGRATMFDLVNLITNQANDPRIRSRAGARRTLEQTGGTIVTEHTERCSHCQSALNN
jgi:hypothetical protein